MTAVFTILIGLLADTVVLLWFAVRTLEKQCRELKRADDQHRYAIGKVDEKIATLAERIEPVEGAMAREADLCQWRDRTDAILVKYGERMDELTHETRQTAYNVGDLIAGVGRTYSAVFKEGSYDDKG